MKLTTRSARATWLLGRRLGQRLQPGQVVALVGDLGAGKTQLTRGACEGAGVAAGDVTSPTFAIVQTYRGRIPIHHADLFRLGDIDELYATGLPELVGGDGAMLVEWADRIGGWLPPEHLLIRLEEVPRRPSWRRVTLVAAGEGHRLLAQAVTSPSRSRAGPRRTSPHPGPLPEGERERSRKASRRSRSGTRSRSATARSGSPPRPRRSR